LQASPVPYGAATPTACRPRAAANDPQHGISGLRHLSTRHPPCEQRRLTVARAAKRGHPINPPDLPDV
jgi:hypothetical protein